MAYNLNNKLVIAISSRALFDLEEENQIFEKNGLDAYYKYQLENQDKSLKKGTGYRLVENILKINSFFSSDERQVEVIILSKNNAATSLRITNAINDLKLDIIRSAWTSGTNISNYLKAFKVDLFLSADDNDVLNAIENGVAAAKILHSNENIHNISNEQVRIAFDGDAVLFSEESELVYKNHGLEAFIEHEKENRNNPLEMGPFAKLLLTIAKIQAKFPTDKSPIRTALVTARSAPTHERVIKTFNLWGVRVDEAFFLGGTDKYEILQAFGADIFFDDQDVHLNLSSNVVPSAKVLNKNIMLSEKNK
ncbi:5'-nucleotidase [Aliarcobacter skirrowii]|uniref:5'-nucleotidase n=1 Tax=Aliarcobacter skirrowii TaxID=28200 RepID=UPI000F663914|nr:5'-nucleotidase [Aliarcobacter skirrowii]AZL53748.1 5'-nucleotidase [Aliarcobacter skirrowii]AZL53755.1 5'-nucleotidase [Aliarcobacter skirrowii]